MGIRLCVVGATGKFGRTILAQTPADIEITGAVTSDNNPSVGRRLSEVGILNSDTVLSGASHIEDAMSKSDVALFVSKPEADVVNVPRVVSKGKRVVVGTTGFTQAQTERLTSLLRSVPSIIASNFSVGANLLFQITKLLSPFNRVYDYSVVEQHHRLKIDAPSGTAKRMVELLNSQNAFPATVSDRVSKPKRSEGELEVVSLRGGGVPGIHQLILAGEYELIRVEHLAFSRAASATGALLACKWIAGKAEPGIYSMNDVLSLTG